MRRLSKKLLISLRDFLLLLLLSHCAGPMTPFGGLSGFFSNPKHGAVKNIPSETQKIQVSFSPTRQVLHQKSDIVVNIHDQDGIPSDSRIQLVYNGYDITDSFVSRSSTASISDDRRSLSIKFKNLKLPSAASNQIEIRYARDGSQNSVVKNYDQPGCSITDLHHTKNTGAFRPPTNWITTINKIAAEQNINPSLFAGIIAQESGFRAKSLSLSRALGLAQITPIADRQISSVHQDWPRYSSIESTPFLVLKTMILSGHLDGGSDWRLNPALAIQGGVTYLGMVRKYWETPANREMLKILFGEDSEMQTQILLASYQSGPSRVNAALKTYGRDYLMSEDLEQARSYVGRISSYCYFFSNEESLYEE